MGFYLRKSISVGPFRFNLSKSGVGVSTGIKGLRFGTGPRGNYVHMGHRGLYYRATLPSSSSKQQSIPENSFAPTIPFGTHAPLEEIESADVAQITDSSSKELLNELNLKRNKTRLWPITAAVATLTLLLGLINHSPDWLIYLFFTIGALAIYIAFNHDTLTKTVVLLYDFDEEMEKAYGQLHSAAEKIASCSASWHIESQGDVYDKKYHAGASSLVQRKKTFILKAEL